MEQEIKVLKQRFCMASGIFLSYAIIDNGIRIGEIIREVKDEQLINY